MAARAESAKPAQWRLKITFWLDVTLLLSICALQTVRFSGLVVHEWLGLAMVAVQAADRFTQAGRSVAESDV